MCLQAYQRIMLFSFDDGGHASLLRRPISSAQGGVKNTHPLASPPYANVPLTMGPCTSDPDYALIQT